MSEPAAAEAADWHRLDDPTPLLVLTADRLYPTESHDPVVVASVAFQTVTKHLCELTGRASGAVPSFDEITWRRTPLGIELRSAASGAAPESTTVLVGSLLEGPIAAWVAVIRDHVRIGARLLWANATASVLYVTTRHRPPPGLGDPAAAEVALRDHVPGGLLATMYPALSTPAFRRSACCLIDRAPFHEPCDECPFRLPRPARDSAWIAVLAPRPTALVLAAAAVDRARSAPGPALEGEPVRFDVTITGGRIESVRFRAHRCVTLLACCEAIARVMTSATVADALALAPPDVLDLVSGLPAHKFDRASLAVQAMQRAVVAADRCQITTNHQGAPR